VSGSNKWQSWRDLYRLRRIETPIELLEITSEWTAGTVLGDIGDGRESAADAGVLLLT